MAADDDEGREETCCYCYVHVLQSVEVKGEVGFWKQETDFLFHIALLKL